MFWWTPQHFGTRENLQPKCEQITLHSICHKVRFPSAATHRLKACLHGGKKSCFSSGYVLGRGRGWGEYPPTPWDRAALMQSLDPAQQSPPNKSQSCFLFTKPYPMEGVRCLMNQYNSLGSPKITISTLDAEVLDRSSFGKATSSIPEYKEWKRRFRGANLSTGAQHISKR